MSTAVVDRLTAQLVDTCVTRGESGAVEIDCRGLLETERYLVRELLIRIWREQCWPEQSMSYSRWDQLADMAAASSASASRRVRMFPGAVTAIAPGASGLCGAGLYSPQTALAVRQIATAAIAMRRAVMSLPFSLVLYVPVTWGRNTRPCPSA